VIALLRKWGESPPAGEAIVSALKAFGVEWKAAQPMMKPALVPVADPQQQEKERDPARLAAMGIKTFDSLPLSMQRLFYDAKHNPEKLGLQKAS
jgi:hypothetical protein